MKCNDVMKRNVAWVGEHDNAHTAARRMRDLNVGFLPVCDAEGRPVGTVTDRDLTIRAAADDHRPSNVGIRDVMTAEKVTCRELDDLEDAERIMSENRKSRLMVIGDDGRLVGVISLSDVADSEEDAAAVVRTAREISQHGAH